MVFEFNSSGQILRRVYPGGVTVTYSYTTGKLSTVSNGLGRVLTFNYTGARLTSVSDGNGRAVSLGFDMNGNHVGFTDTLGKTIVYEYDQPGRMTKYYKPANPTVAYVTNTYDSLSRVKTQENALNQLWSFYFAGSRTEQIDPLGHKFVFYYNRGGQPTRIINPEGFESTSKYDGWNRLIESTAYEGNKVQYTYDLNNNVLTKTSVPKPSSGLSNLQRVDTYDSTWAKLKTTQDPLGNVSTYGLDSSTGYLLTVTRAAVGGINPVSSFTYNARGQILTSTDPTGVVAKFVYDSMTETLLNTIWDYGVGAGHLNLTKTFGYDAVGNLTSFADANGNVWTAAYDTERRLTQMQSPTPSNYLRQMTYDANGNLISVRKQTRGIPLWQTTVLTYTLTDQQESIVDPLNKVYSVSYDGLDLSKYITDAEGRTWTYEHDVLNRPVKITDPFGVVSDARTYTTNGFLKTRTDANGNVTTYTYDGFDRFTIAAFADGTTIQNSSIDSNGNILTVLNRSGSSIAMTFDALNRMSTRTPSGQPTVTYSYDLAGRVTSTSKPVVVGDLSTGAFQTFYDSAGRPYKEQYPDAKTVIHELDGNGNRVKTTWPDGYYVTRSFNEFNQLVNVFLNGSLTPSVTNSYDQLSRKELIAFGNNTSNSASFSLNNDLIGLSFKFAGSSNDYSFGYNNAHQLNAATVSDLSYVWRPSAAGTISYGAADNVNKYPNVGGATLTYDGNKNLTFDGSWTYGYDAESRLVSASKAGTAASYSYDANGRQALKIVNGVTTRFIYDGLRLIATYDGSGNLINRFVFNSGADEIFAQVSAAGVVSFLHQDQSGSVIATTDSSGAVVGKYKYSPYGESASLVGSTFGYTGQRYDIETGLYYYKNRYYAPSLGRFLQPDPIGYLGGMNLYNYCGADPLNKSDPLGLFEQSWDYWTFQVVLHPVPPIYSDWNPNIGWHASIIASHIVGKQYTYSTGKGINWMHDEMDMTVYDFSAGPSDGFGLPGSTIEEFLYGNAKYDYNLQLKGGITALNKKIDGAAGRDKFAELLAAAQQFNPAPEEQPYVFWGSTDVLKGSNSNNYVKYLLDATNLGQTDTGGVSAPGLNRATPQGTGPMDASQRPDAAYQADHKHYSNCSRIGPWNVGG